MNKFAHCLFVGVCIMYFALWIMRREFLIRWVELMWWENAAAAAKKTLSCIGADLYTK